MPVKKNNKIILILLIILAVIIAGYIIFKSVAKKAEINVVSGITSRIRCNKGLKSLTLSDSTSKTIVAQYTCYDNSNGTLSNINPTISRSQIKSMVNNICQRLSKELCERPLYVPSLAPTCQTKGSNCPIGNIGCCAGLTCSNGVCNSPQCKQNGVGGCLADSDCCTGLKCYLSSSAMYGTCWGIVPTSAPIQCKGINVGGCLADSDCCTGLTCALSSSAMYGTCIAKQTTTTTPIQCKANGVGGCSKDTDCCPGLICTFTSAFTGSTCTTKPTGPTPTTKKWQCHTNSQACMSDYDCCSGLTCKLTSTELYGTCEATQ